METNYNLEQVKNIIKQTIQLTLSCCNSNSPITLRHSIETLTDVIINPPKTLEEIKKQNNK